MNEKIITSTQTSAIQDFLNKTYGWMATALALTGLTAYYVANYQISLVLSLAQGGLMWLLLFAQIGLVIYLSARIQKMSLQTAIVLFYVYAITVGITFSTLFLAYTASSLASTFFITAGTFGAMSVYGYFTKTDLSSIGNILLMLLVGLILTSIVNIFLNSPAIYWVTTFVGIFIFVALTAYDTQRLKHVATTLQDSTSEGAQKIAIILALSLYLDFINLFLYLLRLFGSRD